jgi:N-acetylneuraminic acid mutarotase
MPIRNEVEMQSKDSALNHNSISGQLANVEMTRPCRHLFLVSRSAGLVCLLLLLATPRALWGQAAEWTWVGGLQTPSADGVYGQLMVASPTNQPGARQYAPVWRDANGNLWLFGGNGYDSSHQLGAAGELNDLWMYDISTNEWTWMSGSSSFPQEGSGSCAAGVFGTMGTAAAANTPGGNFGGQAWTDNSGNLWLFSGSQCDSTGHDGSLNDLWMYSPTSKEWTWVAGADVNSVDTNDVGIYGTLGQASASNTPGSRVYGATWTDATGKFWMFGGEGPDSVTAAPLPLNDLWMFNPATKEWTWEGGPDTVIVTGYTAGNPGVYEQQGSLNPNNQPGSRYQAATWTDANGNFWLFGGEGDDSTGTAGLSLNDLWMYDVAAGEWNWVGGPATVAHKFGDGGVYGTEGTPAATNWPGGRYGSNTWVDNSGNFWLYGGDGYDSNASAGELDDLWMYNPSSGNWTWMAGSNTANPTPVYPALGTTSASNIPPARYAGMEWTDTEGNFWLFGGRGNFDSQNDLWRFNSPQAVIQTAAATPTFSVPGGNYSSTQSVTISDTTPNATIYYTTNGTTPTASSTQYTGAISVSATETIEAIAVATGYENSAVASAKYTIQLPVAAAPVLSPGAGTFTSSQSVTITDSTAGATIYYTTNGTTPTASSTKYTGAISVSSTETIEAIAVATGYSDSIVSTATYTINLTAATPVIAPAAGTYASTQSVTITDATAGATIYYTTDGTTPTASSTAYAGAITVSSTETIEAIAVASGFANSAVASAVYTINLPAAATPVIAPTAGSFTSTQSVTITDGTAGATIYYTTNGTTPTASSTLYNGAISVTATETIEAIAVAGGFSMSAVATADYVIVVTPPGFTLSANPSSLTIKSGSTGTTVITLTPTGGFTGTVNFSCGTTLPSDVTCSFSPASLTVASGGSAPTATLTVGTTGTTAASLGSRPGATLIPEIFVAMILLPLGLTRRILRVRKAGSPWLMGLLLIVTASLAGAGLLGLAGCGGKASNSTPPGNYSVPVDVTSGATTVPLSLSITVD